MVAGLQSWFASALVLALLLPAGRPAAEPLAGGRPLTARFGVEDYPAVPSNLAVMGDARGVLWVGNAEGVLRFAGGRWELVELPGRSPARALALGHDSRLYVGGYDRFGVVESDAQGVVTYTDLRSRFGLSPEAAAVGNVWDVLVTSAGVWFRAERALFLLGRDGATAHWPLPETLRGVHAVENEIYGRLEGGGLARFVDGAFVPMAGGEAFAERPFNAVLKAAGGSLLVVSNDGFYEVDGGGVERLPADVKALFEQTRPYTGLQLPDGSFALGTFSGDILHYGPDLALRGRYPLGPYSVLAMGLDREGGVWVATEGDLVRLVLLSPWSVFDHSDGLRGSLADSAWFEGSVWVGGTLGLFRSTSEEAGRTRFARRAGLDAEVWDLEATDAGLLLATREGVYVLVGDALRRLVDYPDIYQLRRSAFHRDLAYAVAEDALLVLARQAGTWVERHRLPLGAVSLAGLVEPRRGEVWLGNYRGAPIRVPVADDGAPGTPVHMDASAGLELDADTGSVVFELDQRLYAVSGDAVQQWTGERFTRSDAQGLAPLVQRPLELIVRATPNGTYALTSRQLLRRAIGESAWQPVYLDSALARGFTDLVSEPGGVMRLITWNAMLQFDPAVAEPPKPPLVAAPRKVEVLAPDGSTSLLPLAPDHAVTLPRHRGLRFEFELLSADPGREFRHRVIGLDPSWRPWSHESEVALAALPPGEYTLDVEARTRSGRAAPPLRYSFHVAPLWYQTEWARAAGAFAMVLVVLLVAQAYGMRRARLVQAHNRRLEATIAERTRELERANLQLARLAALDGLTGVPNRRGFDTFLDLHWATCRERGAPLSLLMIDVDHFKRFNDRHGHLAGDEALRTIATELARFASGEHEMLARFGGEEFAMVLSGAPLEAALERAEYVRAHFSERAERDGLTLSIGVAWMVPMLGVAPRQLIDAADAALYQAKRNGRNRVEARREAA